jgi:lysophospholipase L1-like esterase
MIIAIVLIRVSLNARKHLDSNVPSMKMKSFQHTEPPRTNAGRINRRRFFQQSGVALFSTALLTSCDDLIDKIIPSKKDNRDKTLAFFGDSLTIGTGGSEPFYKWVGEAFPERPVFHDGINGQIALSIAIRQGGVPLTVSVAGGKFNGSEPVRITKLNNEFLSTPLNSEVYSRTGTLAGVKCTIKRTFVPEVGEHYTVQPLAQTDAEPPIEVEIPDDSVFELEDAVRLRTATQILWYGRNDVTRGAGEDDVLSAIKSSVEYIAQPRRYLVLGILPAVPENKGTDSYDRLIALNSRLASLYGESYVAMTPPTDSEMQAIGYTPTEKDLANIELGNFPSGMRPPNKADEIHLNNYGYRIIANRVVQKIKDLKY